MAAVLWKYVRVCSAEGRELQGQERDDIAAELKTIQDYSAWDGRSKMDPQQEEVARLKAQKSFEAIEKLQFFDTRNAQEVKWIDVVFKVRRDLDKDDYIRMNLPAEFWNQYHVPDQIKEPMQRYFREYGSFRKDGVGLYIWGPTGCGKSSAAAALAQGVRSLSRTVFFVSVADLRELVRNKIEFDNDQSAIDRCKEIEFLVLDNLRAEDAKETYVGAFVLEDILRHRAAEKRPTVVTSQMSLNALMKSFPGFCEIAQASCVFLDAKGPDLRANTQEKLKERLGLTVKK